MGAEATKNTRDSNPKRLGVKRYEQNCKKWKYFGSTTWN